MSVKGTTISVRDAMTKLIAVLDAVGDDVASAEAEITAAMQDLMAIPGLDTALATPTWTDVDPTRPSTGWLYYDCEYRLVRGHLPAGFVQRPHDHGAWNILGVYRGAMHYRSYRRLDDGSEPYHAELEVAQDRVMNEGDVTVLPGPPHDIHSTAGLAPHTVSFLIARQEFNPMRRQYLPDLSSYYVVDADTAAR
jgi:predicted metal-dependent enzyme (double-stranded beta helix superfamily)